MRIRTIIGSMTALAFAALASASALATEPKHTDVAPASAIPTWSFGWTYGGHQYTASFVGTNPASGGATTVPAYIVPIALKLGGTIENPLSTDRAGQSAVSRTLASPLFQSGIDFVVGGTDLGATQYADAFQRGALWGAGVQANPAYHVLLGAPVVESLVTLTVPDGDGTVAAPFGFKVIEVDLNWFDSQIQPLLSSLNIPANALTIFVTTQSYLTQGQNSCCIGGYHNYNGTQSYIDFSYIANKGAFAQDVSALSLELPAWIDNPFSSNVTPCGGYDVGAGGGTKHPDGTYPYKLNGMTYHLQNLLFPPYFGAPPAVSVNGWASFHNLKLTVCGGVP
jgi:hypothetical protein